MIKSLFFKKRTVIFSWLISYIIILLIPIFSMVVVYYETQNVIKNVIDKSNNFFLGKVQQSMDAILIYADKLSTGIALNQDIQNILNLRYPFEDSRYYDIYRAAESLKIFSESKSYIEDYYLYLKNLNMSITSGISYNEQIFYREFTKGHRISYNDWMKMISGTYGGEYIIMTSDYAQNKVKRSVFYLRSIPFINNGETTANVIIKLDEDKFINAIKGVETVNEGTIIILDKNNQIIAASNESNSRINLKYQDMQGETGLYDSTLNGKKVVISYITSKATEWKYVSIIPESIFREKEVFIRILVLASLLTCIFIGSVLSFLFTRRNYNPLKRLVKSFEDKSKRIMDTGYDEYKFINEAINKTFEEKDMISYKLKEQNKSLRGYFLEGLLKQREETTPTHELLSAYEIKFETDSFLVITFFIENTDELFSNPKDIDSFENYKRLKLIVANIFEGFVNQKNQGIMTEVDGILVCLINLKIGNEDDYKTEIFRITNDLRAIVSSQYRANLLISVSNVQKSLNGVSYAYKEAVHAMEYNRVMGINKVVFYDDIEEVSKVNYYYPMEKENQIINCIKAGESEDAKALVEEICQVNFQNNYVSVSMAKCMMFNMINTIIKAANEISNVYGNDVIEELHPVESFLGCETINQMKANMIKIIDKICKFVEQHNKQTDYKLRDRIIKYIEENYANPDLGIAGIASHLDMNPNYISKVFKDQVGESLLDYINGFRINKAKSLIKRHDYTVEEVAGIVGYTNSRTFTRAFKKHEGVTPGRFR